MDSQMPPNSEGPASQTNAACSATERCYDEYYPGLQVDCDTPGLEAAPAGAEWPERAVPNNAGLVHMAKDDKLATPNEQVAFQAVGSQADDKGQSDARERKRRVAWCVAVVIIIIAAVLGGTLKRLLNQKGSGPGPATTSPGAGDTVNSTAMAGTLPVSVAAFGFQAAVSWGYPHLEFFAVDHDPRFASNILHTVRRNSNATSPAELSPRLGGSAEKLIGRIALLADRSPLSISAQSRSFNHDNRTDIIYIESGKLYHAARRDSKKWPVGTNSSLKMGDEVVTDEATKRVAVLVPPREGQYDPEVLLLGTRAAGEALKMTYFKLKQKGDGSMASGQATTLQSLELAPVAPRAVSWGPGRLDIFAIRRQDRHLLHGSLITPLIREGGGAWTAFDGVGGDNLEDLGGYVTTAPAVVSRGHGRIDVFARGGDGRLWWRTCDSRDGKDGWRGGGADWSLVDRDLQIEGEPEAVSWAEDRVDVFVWASADNLLLHRVYNLTGKGFASNGGWTRVAGNIAGPPKAVGYKDGTMHVFASGPDDMIVWRTWKAANGGWAGEAENFTHIGLKAYGCSWDTDMCDPYR